MKFTFLITFFLICTAGIALSQPAYDAYNPIQLKGKLVSGDGEVRLYLALVLLSDEIAVSNLRFNFYAATNNSTENTEIIDATDSALLVSDNNHHYFRFSFSKATLKKMITVETFNRTDGKKAIKAFNMEEALPFMLFDQESKPVINTFITEGFIAHQHPQSMTAFYYSLTFDPALPPMVTQNNSPRKAMQVDSTFVFDAQVSLTRPGLYLFQTDTSTADAHTVRYEDSRYPRFTRLEELIKPLMYITKKEEYDQLSTTAINKKKFDEFWLDTAEKPERAIAIIKEFYDRVRIANNEFTTFKQGWKTDMGMIYLVMGIPDQVQYNDGKVVWIYLKDNYLPRRTYEFIKTNTIFSPNHHVLIREKKHAQSWYLAINLLRKGILK